MLNKIIKINEKEYTLKSTLRVEMIFEYIKGAPFDINEMNDWRLYFYCMIKANNEYTKPFYSEDGNDFLSDVSNEDFNNFMEIILEFYKGEFAKLKDKDKKEKKKKGKKN